MMNAMNAHGRGRRGGGSGLLRLATCAVLALVAAGVCAEPQPHSVARQWNELMLQAIRNDFARPPIHARNLYHVSAAMWDAWAVYDDTAEPIFLKERIQADDVAAARHEAISYAAYRVLYRRYQISPGAYVSLPSFDDLLLELGYDYRVTEREGNSPAAVGNRIAKLILDQGYDDGADELGSYAFEFDYRPVNPPLVVANSGVGELADPNRWQPLSLRLFVDQAGRVQPGRVQRFIGSHWGSVTSFSLPGAGMAPGEGVFHDPGPPPYLGGEGSDEYRHGFAEVLRYSTTLDPDDGVMMDISPLSFGGNSLGANDGVGYPVNPVTGKPYEPNLVKRGDWARVIAEFWADGPDSETPPGHWNTLANYVTDHPLLERRIGGEGPVLDPLEWDVKLYLALNGAVHDAAVCAWGLKGHYDYVRPITAIRHMAGLGQSSDPELPSYDPHGLPLEPGVAELITEESAAPGERHAHLAEHVGEVAVYSWLGKPEEGTDYTGVDWILGIDWVPYQRDTFVTPPFAGYISGHSTFSRAAAEVMALFTGSEYFPGGLGEFEAKANEFLVFETGPTETVTLQWATYYDASDEAGISRLYGGIHPRMDDLPGRRIGSLIGRDAFARALTWFDGSAAAALAPTTAGEADATVASAAGGPAPAFRFTDVSTAAGVSGDVYSSESAHGLGVNWVDIDNDGWVDLFAVGGAPQYPPRLFRNLGDGTFEAAHNLVPKLPATDMSGSIFADYDNDGDRDIYVYTDRSEWVITRENQPDGPPNLLLQNLLVENGGVILAGEPLFREVAALAGVDDRASPPLGELAAYRTKAAAWLDYNRDGCIDLYIGHLVMNAAGTPANRDRLLRNDCAGGFHEATTAAGLYPPSATEYRGALAVLGAHLDTDLWPDVYVVNVTYGTADPASQLDQIYRNQGGTLAQWLRDSTRIGDDAQWGMGMDVADIDHNGTWDIYISDLLWDTPLEEPPWGNVLYLGTPSGGFTDNQASHAGVVGDDSWGVNFLDVDHDGWEDLFITTMLGAEGEFLFANNGDGTFTNVAGRAGIATGNSRGSAVADYDRDGDLDIALVNHTYCLERPPNSRYSGFVGRVAYDGTEPRCSLQLLRNDSPKSGSWLQLRLVGSASNAAAIGAVVRVEVEGQTLMRQIVGGTGGHSQSSLTVHFGLGPTEMVDAVEVLWPSGLRTRWANQPANTLLEVVEGAACQNDARAGCTEEASGL